MFFQLKPNYLIELGTLLRLRSDGYKMVTGEHSESFHCLEVIQQHRGKKYRNKIKISSITKSQRINSSDLNNPWKEEKQRNH